MADENPDDSYVIAHVAVEVEGIKADWPNTAQYTLKSPARCPHCTESIATMRVVRLSRTQASFTAPLPRGRVLVCPLCDVIISVELSGTL